MYSTTDNDNDRNNKEHLDLLFFWWLVVWVPTPIQSQWLVLAGASGGYGPMWVGYGYGTRYSTNGTNIQIKSKVTFDKDLLKQTT